MGDVELSITDKKELRLDRVPERLPGNVEDDLHMVHVLAFFSIQVMFIILFAFFTEYSDSADVNVVSDFEHYPLYQDVNVMIFIGSDINYTHRTDFESIDKFFRRIRLLVYVHASILVIELYFEKHSV